jgi:acyl-CoA dehydrogenase
MRRRLFTADHDDFRMMVRDFIGKEVLPGYPSWEEAGQVPHEVFCRLGEVGVMGMNMPADWGGGDADYVFNVVLQEETARAGVTIGPLRTHMDVVLPYFRHYAAPEQQQRWFPGLVRGELMSAIALTEPDTGSDLAAVRTRATRDGDDYVLNGAKTYITGGGLAHLVIVLARTSESPDARRKGLTLLVVEDGMPGFVKGRRLQKIGLKAQDTVELTFDNVRIPAANRLGEENEAFGYLLSNLAQERLAIAVGAVAQARTAIDMTIEYARQRTIFGQPLSSFQNTKFEIAAMAAEHEATQTMIDAAVTELCQGELSAVDAAKVKLVCTEMQGRVVDRCLQLFGGFGYIAESPIARLYADARVSRIYGGTSEVMKSIISKSLGL